MQFSMSLGQLLNTKTAKNEVSINFIQYHSSLLNSSPSKGLPKITSPGWQSAVLLPGVSIEFAWTHPVPVN